MSRLRPVISLGEPVQRTGEYDDYDQGTSSKAKSPIPKSVNSPEQPDLNKIDSLLQTSLFGDVLNNPTLQERADAADLGVWFGDTDGFDGPWDFQDDSTVPQLPEICTQMPVLASASVATSRQDASFDFGLAANHVEDLTWPFITESSRS